MANEPPFFLQQINDGDESDAPSPNRFTTAEAATRRAKELEAMGLKIRGLESVDLNGSPAPVQFYLTEGVEVPGTIDWLENRKIK